MNVPEIIDKWPSASEFARDLGLKRESHGTLMRVRGSIPVAYWPRLLDAAAARGFELSYADLVSANIKSTEEHATQGKRAG